MRICHIFRLSPALHSYFCYELSVGDYSAQALINTILTQVFPADPIVGEEDAEGLRDTSSPEANIMRGRIEGLANDALSAPLLAWEKPEWGLGKARSLDQLLDAIDRGNSTGGRTGREYRFVYSLQ